LRRAGFSDTEEKNEKSTTQQFLWRKVDTSGIVSGYYEQGRIMT
jgi:hypothetical protein